MDRRRSDDEMTATRAALGATCAVAVMTACGDAQQPTPSGPVITQADEGLDAPTAQVRGELALLDECLVLRADAAAVHTLVWPSGTTWDAGSERVVGDGWTLGLGDQVAGGGGFYDPDSLDHLLTADGVDAVSGCDASREVAVVFTMSPVTSVGSR